MIFPYEPGDKLGPHRSQRRAEGEESKIGLVAEVGHVGYTWLAEGIGLFLEASLSARNMGK